MGALRIVANLADHALGALMILVALGIYHHQTGQPIDLEFIRVMAFVVTIVMLFLVIVVAVLRYRAKKASGGPRVILGDPEDLRAALGESQTLREAIEAARFDFSDPEDLDAALEESPTFAGEYLEEEAGSP